MRGKRLIRFFRTSSGLYPHTLAANFEKFNSIFPTLDEYTRLAAYYFLTPKNEFPQIVEEAGLKQMIFQTEEYLQAGQLTNSELAIAMTMEIIKQSKLAGVNHKETDVLIAKAYFLEGEILSAGSLDDKERANVSYSKAIKFAKRGNDTAILAKAEKALRSWELHRYIVKESERIVEDFDNEQQEKNTTRLV